MLRRRGFTFCAAVVVNATGAPQPQQQQLQQGATPSPSPSPSPSLTAAGDSSADPSLTTATNPSPSPRVSKREKKRMALALQSEALGLPPSMIKMRRIGPYTVPWGTRRRWMRHMRQHIPFLQWVAFLAARQLRRMDAAAAASVGVGAMGVGEGVIAADEAQQEEEEAAAELRRVCTQIVEEWGVPLMADEGGGGGGWGGEGDAASSSHSLLDADGPSPIGAFVYGPSHINPLKFIDDDEGKALVTLLSHLGVGMAAEGASSSLPLPSSASASASVVHHGFNVRPAEVYGTHQLYAASPTAADDATSPAASSSPFPWLPSYFGSSTSSPSSSLPAAPFAPTASLWYGPAMSSALMVGIAGDKALYGGQQGYGPQVPFGEPMAAIVRQLGERESNKEKEAAGASAGGVVVGDDTTPTPTTLPLPLRREQQLKAIRHYSAVAPSRPLRQDLENFPQEHALCETAFEVVSAWEGGGGSGGYHSTSHCPLRWRPSVIIDVGGGNGIMPWLAGHRFGFGPTHVVNVERYITANNVGFDGGMGPPDARHHVGRKARGDGGLPLGKDGEGEEEASGSVAPSSAPSSSVSVGSADDSGHHPHSCGAIEIPHTNCLLSQLGHGEMPADYEMPSWCTVKQKGNGGGASPASSDAATTDGAVEGNNASCACCPSPQQSPPTADAGGGGLGGASDPDAAFGPHLRWCQYGDHRWSPRELPYYRVVHKDVREVSWRDDVRYRGDQSIVMTKHLCGAGVDHLLRSFEQQQFYPKYLFINSCCHMKSSYVEYINTRYLNKVMGIYNEGVYKAITGRTSWLRQWGDEVNTNAKVASLAEQLQWQHNAGKCIEGLMDAGRVQWLRERGYSAHIVEHVPSEVTPRNKLLIARRHDGLLGV